MSMHGEGEPTSEVTTAEVLEAFKDFLDEDDLDFIREEDLDFDSVITYLYSNDRILGEGVDVDSVLMEAGIIEG